MPFPAANCWQERIIYVKLWSHTTCKIGSAQKPPGKKSSSAGVSRPSPTRAPTLWRYVSIDSQVSSAYCHDVFNSFWCYDVTYAHLPDSCLALHITSKPSWAFLGETTTIRPPVRTFLTPGWSEQKRLLRASHWRSPIIGTYTPV